MGAEGLGMRRTGPIGPRTEVNSEVCNGVVLQASSCFADDMLAQVPSH